jgi:hypothetical protein
VTGRAVALDRGGAGRRAAAVQPARCLSGRRDEPEPVAADAVHVRIDHRDRGRRGDHGFDGVAAFAHHRASGLGGECMGRDGHATAASERRKVHSRIRTKSGRFMYS